MSTTDESSDRDLAKPAHRLASDAASYFDKASKALAGVPKPSEYSRPERDYSWHLLPPSIRSEGLEIIDRLLSLTGRIAPAVRVSLLASEADQRDLKTETKVMRAALQLRRFRQWEVDVLHDEGTVL